MPTNAERLAEYVLARRTALDLTQLDVWQKGGPSNTTLTAIENGLIETLTRTTARKLDIGLEWEAGSARTVWEGGEPTPLLRPGMSTSDSRALRDAILSADLDDVTRDDLLRVLDHRERGAG